MQKITPYLWFKDQAEEAAKFYTSLFMNSKIGAISRFGEGGPAPAGQAMVVPFTLEGQEFYALNGGPEFAFTEAVSFLVNCESQEEVDYYWTRLTENGGVESMCGWLKDRFGLSWQIIPSALGRLMGDPDPVKAGRVMQAMLKMRKIVIADLQRAYDET